MNKNRTIVAILSAAALAGIVSCAKAPEPGRPAPSPSAKDPEPGRPALLASATHEAPPTKAKSDWYGDACKETIPLEQGWSENEVEWFYKTAQGSHFMRYEYFLALEQADSKELFRSEENMRKFRYLTDFKSVENPDDLPIGFVRDDEYVGMTCAACHTTQVNYKGTCIRIQGGGSMADFDSFMKGLIAAMEATLKDPEKLDRFVVNVVRANEPKQIDETREKPSKPPGNEISGIVREGLTKTLEKLAFDNKVNTEGVARYGFARLDAFGRIYNRALTLVDKTNRNPSDAPVSYPFLWDTSQHDYVQWPGNAANANVGELERNIGEVIGVFGDITIEKPGLFKVGYKSSVEVGLLNEMAQKLRMLQSPVWPEETLPPLNNDLVKKGKDLYVSTCQRCHLPINRSDPKRRIIAQMSGLEQIGTDKTMAENVVYASGKTGHLQGQPKIPRYGIEPLFLAGERFEAKASAFDILTNLVAGVLENNLIGIAVAERNAAWVGEGGLAPSRKGDYPKDPKDPTKQFLTYKARPLNGIWATAPFLHNGSVPTLWDLLLPPDKRPTIFYVGRYEIDAKKVGIWTDPFEGAFKFDTSVKGNSNSGHTWGTQLSEDDRWALVEYMKSL